MGDSSQSLPFPRETSGLGGALTGSKGRIASSVTVRALQTRRNAHCRNRARVIACTRPKAIFPRGNVETARESSHALDPKQSSRAAIGCGPPAGATTVLPPQCHKTQVRVIKCELHPTHGPRLTLRWIGLEFAWISEPQEALTGRIEKICLTPPTWGMRAGHFAATIRGRLGRTASRIHFRHAKRLAGNSGAASRQVVLRCW
jgi:hypothetical protein